MLKRLFFTILTINILAGLYGTNNYSIDTFFNQEEKERVLNGEIITRMYLKHNAVGENTHLKIDIPVTEFTDENLSQYEMITDEKAFIPYVLDEEQKLKLYNTLTAYSRLKGMKYWNRGDRVAREFILDCFRIQSSNNRKKAADIEYEKIAPKVVNYFLQKDNKFGSLVYKSELHNEGDNFILENTCIQPIAKVIAINKKNEYKIVTFFLYDQEKQGFYYYSLNVMRIRIDLLLKSGKLYPGTFSNRLRGATVHLAKLLGLNWFDRINPWDEEKLRKGYYKHY